MTLFSLSAFASFDEYGGLSGNFGSPVTNTGAMTAGGNFWSTNVSAMVANNGVVTNNFDYYSPRYYVGTAGSSTQNGWSSAQSVSQYQYRPGDVINTYTFANLETGQPITDALGNEQHGYIVTNGGSIMQPANSYTGYTPLQISNQIMGVGLHDPNPSNRPYFAYNSYNSSNNTNTVNVYEATANGPVLISSKVIVTYNSIPRVGVLGFTAQPPPDFYAAAQLSSKTSLTLAETATYIEKYIDRVFPDIDGAGGRVAQIESLIPKLINGLPDEQKPQARDLLKDYIASDIVDDDTTVQNPIIENTDYVFDEKGNLKAINNNGTGLVQITTKDGPKSPSQLDVNNLDHRKALSRVAVFLAKKLKAPAGTRLSSGTDSKTPGSLAYTEPTPPHVIKLNYKSGAFSKDLDNIYSFTSVLEHELLHRRNFLSTNPHIPSNLSTHVDVYIDAMESNYFKNSPPDFKLGIVKSLAIYIWNMDKKPGITNSLSEIIDKIVTFNSRSSYNGGYRLIAPTDPDNLSYIQFKKGDLIKENFKVYNPQTNQEEPVIFTLNNEK